MSEFARARRTDPETSHTAAKHVKLNPGQQKVLTALDILISAMDHQIYAWLQDMGVKISPSGARSRRAELVVKGLVRWTGRCGKTPMNEESRIWELV